MLFGPETDNAKVDLALGAGPHNLLTLPYLPTKSMQINNIHISIRPSLLTSRVKAQHETRMIHGSAAHLFVFQGLDGLNDFWTRYFEMLVESYQEARKFARSKAFVAFVEICNPEELAKPRRLRQLLAEIDIYSHLRSGDFMYFQIGSEEERANMWTQLAKQVILQQHES